MFSSQFDGKTLDELIDYMLGIDQVTKPGEKYSYYNLGFGVIGKIIEKFSGMSFNDYLEQSMAKAGVYDVHEGKDRAGKRPNECVYYSQSGTNGYGNEMDVIAAAGGVIVSTAEMMKLLPQIDGKDDIADILKPETVEQMYTPSASYERYGLGWRLGHRLYPGAHYHSGNIAGTATIWCGDANNGISAAILCNSRSYLDGFDDNLYYLLGDIVAYYWPTM